jgi:hypothetical protein
MHKHPSGFNTRCNSNHRRHEKTKITANSPLSPEAFPFESATTHHHDYDNIDFHRPPPPPPPPPSSSFCGGGGGGGVQHDWSINDCTNRSVILSRADYDADWHILTANHYHHHQHHQHHQQQLLNPPHNPLTQQQQQQAKRVSLDASHMFWLSQHRNAAHNGGRGMDLDELSFLDHDYGNAGGAVADEYDDSLRDSIDLDDFDEYDDDDDDDETTMEEITHRQWLEHRRRLDLCMQKSQESRQQVVMSLPPIQRSLLDLTQSRLQPAPPQVQQPPLPPPRKLSPTTSLSSSSSSSSTAFAQTQHSMRAVQDQLFGTTKTTTTAEPPL